MSGGSRRSGRIGSAGSPLALATSRLVVPEQERPVESTLPFFLFFPVFLMGETQTAVMVNVAGLQETGRDVQSGYIVK